MGGRGQIRFAVAHDRSEGEKEKEHSLIGRLWNVESIGTLRIAVESKRALIPRLFYCRRQARCGKDSSDDAGEGVSIRPPPDIRIILVFDSLVRHAPLSGALQAGAMGELDPAPVRLVVYGVVQCTSKHVSW